MMRSEESLRLLDLNYDLPTTAADIRALRAARKDMIQNLESYIEFLSYFPEPLASVLTAKKGSAGSKPFEL
jgi:hypothetical protein